MVCSGNGRTCCSGGKPILHHWNIGLQICHSSFFSLFVEWLIAWGNLEIIWYTLNYSTTDQNFIKHLNREQEANQSNFRDFSAWLN